MVSTQLYIEKLGAILSQDRRLIGAYVLGSIVHGPFRKESDIDCALLLRKGCKMDHMERLRLAGELSAILGRIVDIGIISATNLIYAMQAVSGGQLLFSHDKTAVDKMVMHVYSLYVKLREERKEVEKAYECG